MPNAIDVFRAQREAADAVHERLQEIAALLTHVRTQVDAVAGNAELRAILQREEAWLSQASRTVSEVRAWRERDARQFWPSVARRWVLTVALALASAWIAGAGYAYAVKPGDDELRELRARAAFVESIEDRVITMTPAGRRQFDELMKRGVSAKR
jgi:hypothetical protein